MSEEMTRVQKIKELRAVTGVGLADALKAIDAANGDMEEAKKILASGRKLFSARDEVHQELFSYNHGGRIAVVVGLQCSTDFAAKTEEFQKLGKDLAQHLAGYQDADANKPVEFMEQAFVKDPKKTIRQLIEAVTVRTGEQIEVFHLHRLEAQRTRYGGNLSPQ